MKILIVCPRFVSRVGQYYEFPVGMAYVSASLKKAGHEVRCLNLNQRDGVIGEIVLREARAFGAQAVLTGGLTVFYHGVMEILTAAKRADGNVFTIAGGGLISSEPELMMQALPLDYGIIGEGEVTTVELIDVLERGGDVSDIPGIVLLDGGRPRKTQPRQSIEDLDALPWPDYEGFGVEAYLDMQRPGDTYYFWAMDNPRLLPVISSRSCPFRCTFCYHPLGNKYRRRSIDDFFAEVDFYIDRYNINSIGVLDELFPTDPEWVEDFCGRMAERKLLWEAQLRVNSVRPEALPMLRESGLYYISFGIESASEDILKSMKKHITVPQIEGALQAAQGCGIGIQGNLLFGDPAETLESAMESLDWWERYPEYHLNMNFVIPYPGSEIYNEALAQGRIEDKLSYIESGCPPIPLSGMTASEIEQVEIRMAELKVSHRMVGEPFDVHEVKSSRPGSPPSYAFQVQCPHCGEGNAYTYVEVGTLAVFKVSCRQCHQRFDVRPAAFTHVGEALKTLREALQTVADEGHPISIVPCLLPPTFEDIMDSLGLDWRALQVHSFLDDRSQRIGTSFADEVPVLSMTPQTVQAMDDGHKYLVLPFDGCGRFAEMLIRDCAVAREDILSIELG